MIYIHDKEVKDIAERSLLHDIINPTKRAKNINIHYYTILHLCMNTRKGRARFKNFRIFVDSGCSSTIIMRRLVEKIHSEKDAVIQWYTQAVNITTNLKVQVDFTLPALSENIVVTWNCHVDDSTKVRNYMILGIYLRT